MKKIYFNCQHKQNNIDSIQPVGINYSIPKFISFYSMIDCHVLIIYYIYTSINIKKKNPKERNIFGDRFKYYF